MFTSTQMTQEHHTTEQSLLSLNGLVVVLIRQSAISEGKVKGSKHTQK